MIKATTKPGTLRVLTLFLFLALACTPTSQQDAGDLSTADVAAADVALADVAQNECGLPQGFETGDDCGRPYVRAEPSLCPSRVGRACTPEDNNSAGQCASEGDCGATESCVDYYDGCVCAAQHCEQDSDCAIGSACACENIPGMLRNACVSADCRSDADCGGGRCKASFGGDDCCNTGDILGFFCTSDADECTSAADCVGNEDCQFSDEQDAFVCRSAGCICD